MFNELLCTSNYVSYNIQLAQIFGLTTSILISELINIEDKAIRKKKIVDIDNNSYFVVDRKYITSRTTLTESQQKEIEDNLLSIGILEKHQTVPNALHIDLEKIAGVISSGKDLQMSVKAAAKTKKRSKSDAILDNIVKNIRTDNVELKAAYIEWLSSVQSKYGYVNSALINTAQDAVDNFCNHDLDKALAVIKIASVMCWRDMTWAINKYKDENKSVEKQVKIRTKPVKLSTEAF